MLMKHSLLRHLFYVHDSIVVLDGRNTLVSGNFLSLSPLSETIDTPDRYSKESQQCWNIYER